MKTLLLFALSLGIQDTAYAFRDSSVTISAGCNTSRIDGSPDMQRALRAIKAKNGGRNPNLVSCYRSQAAQNRIRRRLNCGRRNCNGIAARVSYHTTGVAADMHLAATNRGVCKILDDVRNEVWGGSGGVGGYGGSLGHLEVRPNGRRAAWNVCGKIPGMKGPGYYSMKDGVKRYMANRSRFSTNNASYEDANRAKSGSLFDFIRKLFGGGDS